jgi:hypothetical protein
MPATPEVRPIRLSDLVTELPPDDAFTAVAVAMEELALAQALVIIHGKERAARLYLERGGHIRFDADGEPVILWSERLRPPTPTGEES